MKNDELSEEKIKNDRILTRNEIYKIFIKMIDEKIFLDK